VRVSRIRKNLDFSSKFRAGCVVMLLSGLNHTDAVVDVGRLCFRGVNFQRFAVVLHCHGRIALRQGQAPVNVCFG